MNWLNKYGIGLAIVGLASSANLARADGYQQGPAIGRSINYTWTGVYVGANAGYSSGDSLETFPVAATADKANMRGGIFGGQIGANYQFGRTVVGAELSYDALNDKSSTLCPDGIHTCGRDMRGLFLATGRLGYAFGNVLPYIKGGYASADMKSTATPPFPGFNDTNRLNGWTLGGGVEWALKSNVSFAIEYDHVDLRAGNFASTPFALGVTRSVDAVSDNVTARLNFKFGARDEYVPMK